MTGAAGSQAALHPATSFQNLRWGEVNPGLQRYACKYSWGLNLVDVEKAQHWNSRPTFSEPLRRACDKAENSDTHFPTVAAARAPDGLAAVAAQRATPKSMCRALLGLYLALLALRGFTHTASRTGRIWSTIYCCSLEAWMSS